MAKHKKTTVIILFVLGAVFFVIGMGVGGFLLGDAARKQYILENGTEAMAIVYEADPNDEGWWSLTYYFENEYNNFTQTKGTTQHNYSYSEAYYYVYDTNAYLTVYYMPDGSSVDAYYDSSQDEEIGFILIFIFGAVGLGLIIGAALTLKRFNKNKKILVNGREAEATFIRFSTNMMVNNNPYYSITYNFIGDDGMMRTTTSPADYTALEAQMFQQIGTFKIKIFHDKSAIDGLPKFNIPFAESAPASVANVSSKIKKCEYCGTNVSAGEFKCPSCGGKISNKN